MPFLGDNAFLIDRLESSSIPPRPAGTNGFGPTPGGASGIDRRLTILDRPGRHVANDLALYRPGTDDRAQSEIPASAWIASIETPSQARQ